MNINKLEIQEKAYELDLDRIDEGYLYDSFVVHAENINKAKTLLLKELRYEDMRIRPSDEELTYLNIPVLRCKDRDKVYFEGRVIRRYQVEREIEENKRLKILEDMLADDSIEWCYIMKGGSYYRPRSCGYTYREEEAGVYLKSDAVSKARSCRELTLVPTTHEAHREAIEKRVKMIQDTAEKEIQILKANCY